MPLHRTLWAKIFQFSKFGMFTKGMSCTVLSGNFKSLSWKRRLQLAPLFYVSKHMPLFQRTAFVFYVLQRFRQIFWSKFLRTFWHCNETYCMKFYNFDVDRSASWGILQRALMGPYAHIGITLPAVVSLILPLIPGKSSASKISPSKYMLTPEKQPAARHIWFENAVLKLRNTQ